MTSSHSNDRIDGLLNAYFRDHLRAASTATMNEMMGGELSRTALERIVWGVVTGYNGREPDGHRRKYAPTQARESRVGRTWHPREDHAIRAALAGEGQRRNPPADVDYVARVLMRLNNEVEERWAKLSADPLGRTGFGFEE